MQSGDVWEGTVALRNVTTGEMILAGVFITYGEDAVTYTARTIDRRLSETITAEHGVRCDFFTKMMSVVRRVGSTAVR